MPKTVRKDEGQRLPGAHEHDPPPSPTSAKDTSRQPPETVVRVPLPDAVDLRDHDGGVTVHDGRGRIPLDTVSGRGVANVTVRE